MERHRITLPVGATDDNVAAARLVAERYADAHGFEIAAGSFSVIASTNGLPVASQGGYLGVAFDVVVGKGDIDCDQRVPGVLDRWSWSARMLWWRKVLTNGDGRQGRRLAARDDVAGRVLPGPWGGADALAGDVHPPGDRGSSRVRLGATRDPLAATGGCTCHIGGPFRDICPIHFKADT
ncbi:hypothetical protein PBI_INDLOVU_69 [Mycobacterium phage Indlovu]|nr:hypothetical protein PBI_INDLOVU_69 [Mycobacterium phage Indlovu]